MCSCKMKILIKIHVHANNLCMPLLFFNFHVVELDYLVATEKQFLDSCLANSVIRC